MNSMLEKITAIATKVRMEEEKDIDGDLSLLDGTCSFMATRLVSALEQSGIKAFRVPGAYLGADDDYEPDTSQWDDYDIENFDSSAGYSHWWVEAEGYIVDICVDQFHPSQREDYAVNIKEVGSSDYQSVSERDCVN